MKATDWKAVRRLAKKLGVFKGQFDPCGVPFESSCWIAELSTRGRGKTTAYLLLGMMINHIYGEIIEFCRLMPDDIKPMNLRTLFDVIVRCGYVKSITEGKYNNCIYTGGFWYYTFCDDKGVEVERAEKPFMHVFAVRKALDMRGYNSNSSFLIFDEFIDPTKMYKDDFVNLSHAISTIVREREQMWICLLANTIEKQSIWFKELGISYDVAKMKQGDSLICTNGGTTTPVWVHIATPNQTEKKHRQIRNLFNFKNPKLNTITGTDDGWAVKIYPRLPRANTEVLLKNVYINASGFLVKCEVLTNEEIGLALKICSTYNNIDTLEEDAILYTTEYRALKRDRYLLKDKDKLTLLIRKLIIEGKVFFSDTQAGITFESFMSHCS